MEPRTSSTQSLRKLSVVLLLTLITFGITVRPLTRPHGSLDGSFGLRRQALVSEPANDHDTPRTQPLVAVVVTATPLILAHLLLKLRRAAYRPVPVRRLKLPARRKVGSLLSD
jgi:hypothetical protein